MDTIEHQLKPDEGQTWKLDVSPEERNAMLRGVDVLRERVVGDSKMAQSIQAVLDWVQRSYAEDLYTPHLELSAEQRDSMRVHTCGTLLGLQRAVDYLTDDKYLAVIESSLNKEH